jgi:hypothetical protein
MTSVSTRTLLGRLVPFMICLALAVPLAAAWSPVMVPAQQLPDAQLDNYQICPEGISYCQHRCDALLDPHSKLWCSQSCELRCSMMP